jgi:hypothetical protein
MGAVNFSLEPKLVEQLKQVLPLSVFVETGTFEGEAVNNVICLFEEIHTIELSEEYYLKASRRFQGQSLVKVYHNRSERLLQTLCPLVKDKSVLYWLDAHWCVADSTAGYHSQCPLLQELNAIQALNAQSIILIDDARLFLCPPPKPHEISQWPDFNAVIKKLFSLSSVHQIMVVNDVIIYYPASINSALKTYAHENSIDLLSVLDKSREYDGILLQLKEKEKQIKMLAAATEEKEKQIKMLAATTEERLRLIEKLDEELKNIHRQSN